MDTKDAGRIGGKSTSQKKKAAARKNGKRGGRKPRHIAPNSQPNL